jgi:hypothetical protein
MDAQTSDQLDQKKLHQSRGLMFINHIKKIQSLRTYRQPFHAQLNAREKTRQRIQSAENTLLLAVCDRSAGPEMKPLHH